MPAKPAPIVLPPLLWKPSPNQSARRTAVGLVVAHRPVGSYASSVAWLSNSRAQASAHVIVREDGKQATQLVSWEKKAWACMAFNSYSDNVEMPDAIWTKRFADLSPGLQFTARVCSRIIAFRLYERNLPCVWIHSGDIVHRRGFTRHYDLGLPGGGHSDPTTDLKIWGDFCALVSHEYKRAGFRKVWGQ